MRGSIIISIMLCAALISVAQSTSAKNASAFEPYIEMAEVAPIGKVAGTIWFYSPKARVDDTEVCKYAVKVIIFEGALPNKERRILGRTPLVPNNMPTDAAYFDWFFESREFLKYCRVGMDGYIEQGNVIKLKRGYRIGKLVVIDYNLLRQRLEDDDIIKKMYE